MAIRGCASSQDLRSSTRGGRTRSFSIIPRREGRVDAFRCSNGQTGLALAVVSLLGAFQLEMAKQAIASDSTYGSPPLEISVESLRYRDASADEAGEDQTAAKRTAAGTSNKSSTTNKSKTAAVENDIAAKRKAAAARRMKQIQEGRTESPKTSGLASSEGASSTISDAESLKMERTLASGDGSKENVEARSPMELETSSREINALEEKATAEKAAAEKAAAEKAAAEKAAAEKAAAEKAAAEKAAAEKAAAEKVAAEKAAAEKAAAEKAAAEKAAAEKAAAEKVAAEKAAAEKAAAEKAAAEKADLLKTKRQNLAAERAASLKKAADMAAAEREKAARKLISERSEIPSDAAKSPMQGKVVPSIEPSKGLSGVSELLEQEKETVKLAESKPGTKSEFQKQETPAESETAKTLKETGLASTSPQSKSMKSSKIKSEISKKRLSKTNDESLIASSKKYEKYAKIVVNATEAAVLSIETISAVIVLRFVVSSIWKILKLALPVAFILGFVALCMALM